jgi:outer membrane lipoprotein-sorting protein
MRRSARVVTCVAGLASVTLLAPGALALSGQEVLERVDRKEYSAEDTTAVVEMELVDKDGTVSKRKMEMFQKGEEKRLIKFLEPADVKGMAFLDAGDDKMYLYLPAMHKIRRIAGHVKNDNFAGTDFSFDDLSSEKFSERLKVVGMEESDGHYLLHLEPKPGSDTQYGKLNMWVRQEDFMFDKIEFYDKSGEKWKVMTRKDFRDVGQYRQSFWVQMEDLNKSHKTRNIIQSIKCDMGLRSRFFSKRQLKR